MNENTSHLFTESDVWDCEEADNTTPSIATNKTNICKEKNDNIDKSNNSSNIRNDVFNIIESSMMEPCKDEIAEANNESFEHYSQTSDKDVKINVITNKLNDIAHRVSSAWRRIGFSEQEIANKWNEFTSNTLISYLNVYVDKIEVEEMKWIKDNEVALCKLAKLCTYLQEFPKEEEEEQSAWLSKIINMCSITEKESQLRNGEERNELAAAEAAAAEEEEEDSLVEVNNKKINSHSNISLDCCKEVAMITIKNKEFIIKDEWNNITTKNMSLLPFRSHNELKRILLHETTHWTAVARKRLVMLKMLHRLLQIIKQYVNPFTHFNKQCEEMNAANLNKNETSEDALTIDNYDFCEFRKGCWLLYKMEFERQEEEEEELEEEEEEEQQQHKEAEENYFSVNNINHTNCNEMEEQKTEKADINDSEDMYMKKKGNVEIGAHMSNELLVSEVENNSTHSSVEYASALSSRAASTLLTASTFHSSTHHNHNNCSKDNYVAELATNVIESEEVNPLKNNNVNCSNSNNNDTAEEREDEDDENEEDDEQLQLLLMASVVEDELNDPRGMSYCLQPRRTVLSDRSATSNCSNNNGNGRNKIKDNTSNAVAKFSTHNICELNKENEYDMKLTTESKVDDNHGGDVKIQERLQNNVHCESELCRLHQEEEVACTMSMKGNENANKNWKNTVNNNNNNNSITLVASCDVQKEATNEFTHINVSNNQNHKYMAEPHVISEQRIAAILSLIRAININEIASKKLEQDLSRERITTIALQVQSNLQKYNSLLQCATDAQLEYIQVLVNKLYGDDESVKNANISTNFITSNNKNLCNNIINKNNNSNNSVNKDKNIENGDTLLSSSNAITKTGNVKSSHSEQLPKVESIINKIKEHVLTLQARTNDKINEQQLLSWLQQEWEEEELNDKRVTKTNEYLNNNNTNHINISYNNNNNNNNNSSCNSSDNSNVTTISKEINECNDKECDSDIESKELQRSCLCEDDSEAYKELPECIRVIFTLPLHSHKWRYMLFITNYMEHKLIAREEMRLRDLHHKLNDLQEEEYLLTGIRYNFDYMYRECTYQHKDIIDSNNNKGNKNRSNNINNERLIEFEQEHQEHEYNNSKNDNNNNISMTPEELNVNIITTKSNSIGSTTLVDQINNLPVVDIASYVHRSASLANVEQEIVKLQKLELWCYRKLTLLRKAHECVERRSKLLAEEEELRIHSRERLLSKKVNMAKQLLYEESIRRRVKRELPHIHTELVKIVQEWQTLLDSSTILTKDNDKHTLSNLRLVNSRERDKHYKESCENNNNNNNNNKTTALTSSHHLFVHGMDVTELVANSIISNNNNKNNSSKLRLINNTLNSNNNNNDSKDYSCNTYIHKLEQKENNKISNSSSSNNNSVTNCTSFFQRTSSPHVKTTALTRSATPYTYKMLSSHSREDNERVKSTSRCQHARSATPKFNNINITHKSSNNTELNKNSEMGDNNTIVSSEPTNIPLSRSLSNNNTNSSRSNNRNIISSSHARVPFSTYSTPVSRVNRMKYFVPTQTLHKQNETPLLKSETSRADQVTKPLTSKTVNTFSNPTLSSATKRIIKTETKLKNEESDKDNNSSYNIAKNKCQEKSLSKSIATDIHESGKCGNMHKRMRDDVVVNVNKQTISNNLAAHRSLHAELSNSVEQKTCTTATATVTLPPMILSSSSSSSSLFKPSSEVAVKPDLSQAAITSSTSVKRSKTESSCSPAPRTPSVAWSLREKRT